MTRRKWILAPLALVLAAALAWAVPTETYEQDMTIGLYRSGLAAADAVDLTGGTSGLNISAVTTYAVGSAPTIAASVRFSVASATVVVTAVKGRIAPGTTTWDTQGTQRWTVTAYSSGQVDSLYMSDDVFIDGTAASHLKIVIGAPSAGTVSIRLRKTKRD